jgi:hypothetical protein
MLTTGSVAHSFVENEAFKRFCHRFGYKPPHQKAVSEKLIPELYSEIEASVQQIIRATNFVSLSADGWNDRRKRKLINGIVHQLTSNIKNDHFLRIIRP